MNHHWSGDQKPDKPHLYGLTYIIHNCFTINQGLKLARVVVPLNSPATPSTFFREPKGVLVSLHNTLK